MDWIYDVKRKTARIVYGHPCSVIMDLLAALKILPPDVQFEADEWNQDYRIWRHKSDAIGVLRPAPLGHEAPADSFASSGLANTAKHQSSMIYTSAKFHTLYHPECPHYVSDAKKHKIKPIQSKPCSVMSCHIELVLTLILF